MLLLYPYCFQHLKSCGNMHSLYWSTTCRPLVEVGRDEDEELQQDGMVLEDVTAADDEDHDGDDGDEGE